MELALIGLQNSGKSAVFDLIAGPDRSVPQTMPERRVMLRLPDPRLDALSRLLKPKKTTPATASVLDPAPGGKDEGREGGDAFAGARTADGLIVVLRAFEAPAIPHPSDTIDAVRDMRGVLSELLLSDLVVVDGRLDKIARRAKVGVKPENPLEIKLLERCRASLENEEPLKELQLSPGETKLLSGFGLLSTKPMLAVLNVGESTPKPDGATPDRRKRLATFVEAFPGTAALSVCAPLELELAGMERGDAREFLEAEGIENLGGWAILEALPAVCRRVIFYTVVRDEIRAWTIPAGATAAEAAGAVHTDMEKGFIKAEIVGWEDLVALGSTAAAREKGLLRLEGREYEVQDGDVITVRFSPR